MVPATRIVLRLIRDAAAACALAVLLAEATGAVATEPVDPMQAAVIDSLAFPVRTTPAELLEAVIRTADVDAIDVSLAYLRRLVDAVEAGGGDRAAMLADLGEGCDAAALSRLDRMLTPREPAAGRVIAAIRAAAAARRRDPARLAAAAADLAAADRDIRAAAAERLAAAGADALPTLVDMLQSDAPASARARGLVQRLGPAARQPLLDWLAADDVEHWPGIIEALVASGAEDIETFLLAPALVSDTPAAARDAAVDALRVLAAARDADQPAPVPPPIPAAVARLARRLDHVLSSAGLPAVDHLLLEPVTDPRQAATAFGGAVTGTVERMAWNPQARRFDRLNVPPRVARAQEAMHIARDLMALAPEEPTAIHLALLARLEATLLFAGDPTTALDRLDPNQLRTAIAAPRTGFSSSTAADVLDAAVTHGLWEAAAAAARTLEPLSEEPDGLPAEARKALVRALAVPDPAVQFAAARALVSAAGQPPYAGSSRVVDILVHAATSTGADRAVVAHPHVDIAQELAADISRFGYEPVVVATGREAIFAARASADTTLVLLGARTIRPTPLETVQFLRQQGVGTAAPVLVVVDPGDDDGRGCFLQRLILTFCDMPGITIVDRLDSFFKPDIDPQTGRPRTAARFPDALAQVGGPAAVDPASRAAAARARLGRAREALALLALLGRRGQDVSAGLAAARAALPQPDLHEAALALLAAIGRADAQETLHDEARRGGPTAGRRPEMAALEASVARHGLLLTSRDMRADYRVYNQALDADSRRAAAEILDVIEAPSRARRSGSADAPPVRPIR